MITLRRGGASATIDPRNGLTCTSLSAAGRDVLGVGGMRIHFPWVGGRAPRPARLRVGGRIVDLGGGVAAGLAGGVWTVDHLADDCVQASLGTDANLHQYPFELVTQATWRVTDEGLRLELQISNGSKAHAPFGLGIRLDVAPVGEHVQLLAPAEEHWPLDATGTPLETAPVGVAGTDVDFRRPAALQRPSRACLTRRHFANLRTLVAVIAPATGREVWLETSADFAVVEVALQPDGSGGIESATCTPDAFALHAAGLPTGLRVLAPGETWRGYALVVARPARID